MASRFGDELVAATEAAQRWAIFDPDPLTRGSIDTMIDAGDPALIRLFDGRLAFGTAGLRAQVGAGPNRMNALVVRQTTAAVVRWLRLNGPEAPRILIGFDARHDSQRFAAHAAATVLAGGGISLRSTDVAPTPTFAHAVLRENADAAIVITASHNPPADNGYKLYLGDGLQLVAPIDTEIATLIDEITASWHHHAPQIDDAFAELDEGDLVATQQWVDSHVQDAVDGLFNEHRDLSVAYTAMHGVGGQALLQAFQAAGFAAPHVVHEQFEPDGDFPTVPFPNPEEDGASDLVMALATNVQTDAALAHDPDADRLAVSVPDQRSDEMVALSGNQLGVLLADHVLRHTSGPDRMVARSVVSSRMLDAMAKAAGVRCDVTLTGFKWVARSIVTRPNKTFVFGYEEALGYCVGDRVRDKDGIGAALTAAEMLATLKAQGTTVWERLDALASVHGVYANHPISVRFDDDPSRVDMLMERVQSSPPDALAGSKIVQTGPLGLGSLPPATGLHMLTADGTQVIVRPSGTEPKIKAYLEVIEPVAGGDIEAARYRANQRLEAVASVVSVLLS